HLVRHEAADHCGRHADLTALLQGQEQQLALHPMRRQLQGRAAIEHGDLAPGGAGRGEKSEEQPGAALHGTLTVRLIVPVSPLPSLPVTLTVRVLAPFATFECTTSSALPAESVVCGRPEVALLLCITSFSGAVPARNATANVMLTLGTGLPAEVTVAVTM